MKTGILITTFLRDNSLKECVKSILDNWNQNYYPIVVDQGNFSEEKDNFFKDFPGEYHKIKYDVGPLVARNYAIKRFSELNIEYFLMFADSLRFTNNYDFSTIIQYLQKNEPALLCGFDIKNRVPWECDISITNEGFLLDIPRKPQHTFENITFQEVDICRNCFLAKTQLLLQNPYTESRLMGDHETSFMRWKKSGFRFFYTNDFQFLYKKDMPQEYQKARNRLSACLKQMKEDMGFTKWVSYTEDLKKVFDNYNNLTIKT